MIDPELILFLTVYLSDSDVDVICAYVVLFIWFFFMLYILLTWDNDV
jgi:hypothetical protein